MDVNTAVKRLRESVGLSQQAFATELGLSIRSIANYERDRVPEREVLVRLVGFAMKHQQPRLAQVFSDAMIADLDPIKRWAEMGRFIERVLPAYRGQLANVRRDLQNKDVDPETRIAEAVERLELIESVMGRNFSRWFRKPEANK